MVISTNTVSDDNAGCSNLSIGDMVLESSLLANELEQSVQHLYKRNHFLIQLTRLSAIASVVSTGVGLRLYYVLYHAPFRHAWRLREAKRRVPQYQRAMKGFSIAGVGGFLFLFSPIGFPQKVERHNAEIVALDAFAMRCLVIKEQGEQLRQVGNVNRYSTELIGKENILQERPTHLSSFIRISIPCWNVRYCAEQYASAKEEIEHKKKRWWSSLMFLRSSFWTSSSRTSDAETLPNTSQNVLFLSLHPEKEIIQKEWVWALEREKRSGKEQRETRGILSSTTNEKVKRTARYALLRPPLGFRAHFSEDVTTKMVSPACESVETRNNTSVAPHQDGFSESPLDALASLSSSSSEISSGKSDGCSLTHNESTFFHFPSLISRCISYPHTIWKHFLPLYSSLHKKSDVALADAMEWNESVVSLRSLWYDGILKPLDTVRTGKSI